MHGGNVLVFSHVALRKSANAERVAGGMVLLLLRFSYLTSGGYSRATLTDPHR